MILKEQNQNLVEIVEKKEEERKFFEDKNKDLLDRNDKLVKHMTSQLLVQGPRHLLCDMIIVEAKKIRPYLIFI